MISHYLVTKLDLPVAAGLGVSGGAMLIFVRSSGHRKEYRERAERLGALERPLTVDLDGV